MSEPISEISYTPDELVLTVPWGNHVEAVNWLLGSPEYRHPLRGGYRVQSIEIQPFGPVQHMDGRVEYEQARIIGKFAKFKTCDSDQTNDNA